MGAARGARDKYEVWTKLYEEYSTFLNSGYFRYKTVDVNQDNTRLYIRVSQLEISLQLKKRVLGKLGPFQKTFPR